MIKHYRTLLLVFALFCNTVVIQAQNVSLKLNNVTVKEAIEAVKKQTGKSFFFNVNDVDLNHRGNIDLKDAPLGKALSQILQGQDIDYEVKDNHIVLSKRNSTKNNQTFTVVGQVTDEKGVPLIGVNITAKGHGNTVTDIDGNYSIKAAPGIALVFSYIGYLQESVKVNKQKTVNVQMTEDTKALNEVVVIGYGTQKKANLTGAVDAISSKEIEDRPVSNLGRALQGAVPNLNITYGSGKPNEGTNINIRGFGSINQDAKPLVLIDGVEGNLDNINPRDVESISVLKDASSAAIYGARASFGVILVTTKKGQDGTAKVSYNGRFSFSSSTVKTNFLTTGYDAAKLVDEYLMSYNGTRYTKYSKEDFAELEARRYDKTENPERPWTVIKNVGGVDQYMHYANFDWYNYLISNSRPTWDNNLSITGGTQKLNYFVSANYHTEDGIYKQNTDRFETANIRARISGDIKDWFNLTVTSHLYHSRYEAPGLENGNNIANYTFHAMPFLMPYNPDGTHVFSTPIIAQQPTDGVHIMTADGNTFTDDKFKRLTTSVNATFKLYKGLTLHANYSFRYDTQDKVVRTAPAEYSTEPGVIIPVTGDLFKNKLRQRNTSEYYHMVDAYLSYDNTFNHHHIRGLVGFNYEQDYQKNLYSTMMDIQSNNLNDFNLGNHTEGVSLEGGQYEWALESFFGRVGYDWKGRYLAEVNLRWDASSRFRRDKRAAVFPSVSAGWRVSEEPFFAPIRNTFSNFKIRGSFGSLGNQAISSPYPYIQTLDLLQQNYLVNGEFLTYASVSAPTAGNFTWETVVHGNLGLDLGFFNNRLTFAGDLYIRDTKDMLTTSLTLPDVFGAKTPKANCANLRTKGWEITLSWQDEFQLAGSPFSYNVSASVGDYITKITKYHNPDRLISDHYVGKTLGEIWGYRVEGLFRDQEDIDSHAEQSFLQTLDKVTRPGQVKFADLNQDGKIDRGAYTTADPGDLTVIGNETPRYCYGINLGFNWNGIGISTFWQGVGKKDWYPRYDSGFFWGQYNRPFGYMLKQHTGDKVYREELDNWDTAYWPRYTTYQTHQSSVNRPLTINNDRYMQDVSYIRLKNITVDYTFPDRICKRLHIKGLKVWVSGENLWTYSPMFEHCDNYDPEVINAGDSDFRTSEGDGYSYPMLRTVTLGVNLSF